MWPKLVPSSIIAKRIAILFAMIEDRTILGQIFRSDSFYIIPNQTKPTYIYIVYGMFTLKKVLLLVW